MTDQPTLTITIPVNGPKVGESREEWEARKRAAAGDALSDVGSR